ncbi:head assembly cochaperone with GroEL [Acinetobacter phage Henu6]|jgi:hypothetical protein|uniref:Head assembly cochaperone with GroEL n=1 Tax=Acinetobacter phage Henu6 TaxID=2500136 RepID=A0A410T528_9CAUD|nr:head assembly cochaperone with GroEL [Acinetobacter phage Henu6]
MSKEIVALGEYVVLKAVARSAGTEIFSDVVPDLVIGVREQGEVPKICEVFKIGPNVPKGLFEIGDGCPFPLGDKLNVPHPDVAYGNVKEKDRDEKYITCHYRNIACVYK